MRHTPSFNVKPGVCQHCWSHSCTPAIKQTPFVKDIQCVSSFPLVCCRLFGHTGACSACGQSIPASEMVMRAQGNVYHLKVGYVKPCKGPVHPKIKILSFTHPHVPPHPELFSSEEHKRLCLEGCFCPYDRIKSLHFVLRCLSYSLILRFKYRVATYITLGLGIEFGLV